MKGARSIARQSRSDDETRRGQAKTSQRCEQRHTPAARETQQSESGPRSGPAKKGNNMRARSRVLLSARARWLAQRSTVAACGATRAAKRSSALVEPKVPVATEDWSYHLRLGPAREATILIACLAALSLAIACSPLAWSCCWSNYPSLNVVRGGTPPRALRTARLLLAPQNRRAAASVGGDCV